MKLRLFAPVLTGLVVALGAPTTWNQPSYAGSTTFYCGMRQSVPVTYARTPRGNVPIIRWVSSNYFPAPWNPQQRCRVVAQRFQRNYDNGTLRAIVPGTLKGEPVVCAAISRNSPCTDRTLLFTLKRGSNPSLTVGRLMDRRGLASGNGLNESGSNCVDDCPIDYVDVTDYLNNVPVESNSQSDPEIDE